MYRRCYFFVGVSDPASEVAESLKPGGKPLRVQSLAFLCSGSRAFHQDGGAGDDDGCIERNGQVTGKGLGRASSTA